MAATLSLVSSADGSPVGTSSHALLDAYVEDAPNTIGTMMAELSQADALVALIVASLGGPYGAGAIAPVIAELSLFGDGAVDCRMLIEEYELTFGEKAGLKIEGENLGAGYGLVGIDRVAFTDQTLPVALLAPAGTVPTGTGVISAQPTNPTRRGILDVIPGANPVFRFTGSVHPAIARVRVTVDVNSDRALRALRQVMSRVAGAVIPGDTAPLGERSTFYIDTSDASLNIAGVTQSIACGYASAAPFLTIDPASTDEATGLVPQRAIPVKVSIKDLVAQTSYQGGASDHGIPQGSTVTRMRCINPDHDQTAINWDASLLLVSYRTPTGGGGLAFYPHDELLHPFTQDLAVNDFAYDKPRNRLAIATEKGVLTKSANVLDKTQAAVLGGLRLKIAKVWTDGATVLAWADGNSGPGDGIYQAPPVAGDAAGATDGYAGWSCLQRGSYAAVDGTAAHLYFVDKNTPHTVRRTSLDLAGAPTIGIDTPDGSAVTSLTYVPETSRLYVCTETGALGLCTLVDGGTQLLCANPDSSLVDASRTPLQVTGVTPFFDGSETIDDRPVALFAHTDQGEWWSDRVQGGNWKTACGQNGLNNTPITMVAAGRRVTSLTVTQHRMYFSDGSEIWASYDGGESVEALRAKQLTTLPFVTELARQVNGGTYPDNNVAALGNVAPGADLGGSGTALAIPASNPHALAAGDIYARRRSEIGGYTARIYRTTTFVPWKSIDFGSLPDIGTTSLVGTLEASALLAYAEYRGLVQASRPRITTRVSGTFRTPTAKARRLRPTHMVALNFGLAGTTYDHLQLFVQKRRLSLGIGGAVNIDMDLSNHLIPPLTSQELNSDLLFTGSKALRLAARSR